jgi:UTP--glucose-1-phosphate uridylyltransferase
MSRIRKAVIPAAGYGTRFLPITKVVPKELLPIGNKPAIHYVVEEAVAAGIEEIILVCHPSKTEILDYFRPDRDLKAFLEKKGKKEEILELERIESQAKFTLVYQQEALGLGHAVLCAKEAVGNEPFLVMLPDVLVFQKNGNYRQLVDACSGEKWGVLVERVSPLAVSHYGIIRTEVINETTHRLLAAVEKPKPSEAPSNLSILGRYLLPAEIFGILEGLKVGSCGEIQLTDAIHNLAKTNPGLALIAQGDIFDIGTPEGMREAYRYHEEFLESASRIFHKTTAKVAH